MSEQKTIKVQFADGRVEVYTADIDNEDEPVITVSVAGLDRRTFSGGDLFDAFNELRRELERLQARLLCAGARRDVFPSGMSRDMSGGRKAYITRIGRPSLREDLVDIFDEAAPESVGTVAEQSAFHERWADSLSK